MRQLATGVLCTAALTACFPSALPPDGGTGLPPFDAGIRPDAGEVPVNPELTAWVEQGAEGKITAAYEAGTLDEKTAALYGALAQWAPSQLPPEYSPGTNDVLAPSFVALLRAKDFVADYTPAQRALYDALVARPGTPAFRAFAAGAGSGNCWDGQLNGTTTQQLVDQTASVSFFVVTNKTGTDTAPALAALAARLSAALGADVTVSDGALKGTRKLKDFFQAAATTLGSWGLPPPSSLPAVLANGGKVPVIVTDCSGAGFNENGGATSEGEIFLSLPSAFEDPALRKVIFPHELAHLYTANVTARDPHKAWPFEAIAVALEDELVRDVHRWTATAAGTPFKYLYGPMNRAFWCPEEPFHSNNHGKCQDGFEGVGSRPFPGRAVNAYSGDYSRFVFFKWYQARAGGAPNALAVWWFRYSGASGDPRGLITLDELSQFQDDLTSYFDGADVFTSRDRALFKDPKSELDLEPGLRQRYTFRFELEQYADQKWRIAPTQVASTREPKRPDSQRFMQLAGSTHRVLVELPDLPLSGMGARLASLTYLFTGPAPKVTFHYLQEGFGMPVRERLSATLPELLDAEPGWLPFSPTSTASRFVLVQATMAALPASGKTRGQWGVSIPHRCEPECLAYYRTKVPACCPAHCEGTLDPGCMPDCNDVNVREGPIPLCNTACLGKNEPYATFDGTSDGAAGPAFCGAAGLSEATWAGLVPLDAWPDVSCTTLETAPNN